MDSAGDFVIAWADGGPISRIPVRPWESTPSATLIPRAPAARQCTGAIPQSARPPARPTRRSRWSRPGSSSSPGNSRRLGTQSGCRGPAVRCQRECADQRGPSQHVPRVTSRNSRRSRSTAKAISSWRGRATASGGRASSKATILAQRVNSGGTLIGPTQFQPSTQSGDNQTIPNVASNPYGNAIIVWQSKPSQRSSNRTSMAGFITTSTMRPRSTRRRM